MVSFLSNPRVLVSVVTPSTMPRTAEGLNSDAREPPMTRGLTIDQLEPGRRHTAKVEVTDRMVRAFAEATGDHNPIHLDDDAARATPFGRRIAHGLLIAGFVSGILGMEFPGPGTVYVSQTLKFVRPVFLGDTVTIQLEVTGVDHDRHRVTISTTCTTDAGAVLVGDAVVLPPR
jgi:3-hydroxybutyryl-CoA dehydratase